jgi:hypothetical protein
MVNSGVVYRIISDNLGSPRIVVEVSTGAIMQQIEYDEFGNIISDRDFSLLDSVEVFMIMTRDWSDLVQEIMIV